MLVEKVSPCLFCSLYTSHIQIVEAIDLAGLRITGSVLGIDDERGRIASPRFVAAILPERYKQVVLWSTIGEGLGSGSRNGEASKGKEESGELHDARLSGGLQDVRYRGWIEVQRAHNTYMGGQLYLQMPSRSFDPLTLLELRSEST